jgi:hypothetical protein
VRPEGLGIRGLVRKEILKCDEAMNGTILLDTTECIAYANRCFGGIYHLLLQGRNQARNKLV